MLPEFKQIVSYPSNQLKKILFIV